MRFRLFNRQNNDILASSGLSTANVRLPKKRVSYTAGQWDFSSSAYKEQVKQSFNADRFKPFASSLYTDQSYANINAPYLVKNPQGKICLSIDAAIDWLQSKAVSESPSPADLRAICYHIVRGDYNREINYSDQHSLAEALKKSIQAKLCGPVIYKEVMHTIGTLTTDITVPLGFGARLKSAWNAFRNPRVQQVQPT